MIREILDALLWSMAAAVAILAAVVVIGMILIALKHPL